MPSIRRRIFCFNEKILVEGGRITVALDTVTEATLLITRLINLSTHSGLVAGKALIQVESHYIPINDSFSKINLFHLSIVISILNFF